MRRIPATWWVVLLGAAGLWLSATYWTGSRVDPVDDARLEPTGVSEGVPVVMTSKLDKSRFQLAPDIRSQSWLNGAPTSLAELRGRVVLVDFWTFDCINCQNVMPSLKELHRKYSDKGLTIIGVHSPEFDSEHETANVQQAIQRFGLPYLVAQDNDFANWNAYRNHYWPSLYLIDKEGYLRFNHIGEGDYDKIDAAVRQLLNEA